MLDLGKLPDGENWFSLKYVLNFAGTTLSLAAVEVKKRISATSVNQYQIYARQEPSIGS